MIRRNDFRRSREKVSWPRSIAIIVGTITVLPT